MHRVLALLLTLSAGSASAGPYGDDVLADSPVGYWPLDSANETIDPQDLSGTGNSGRFVVGVTQGVPGVIAADPNAGAQFDGVIGEVQAPDNAAYTLGNTFTFEAWIRTTDDVCEIFSNFEEAAPYEGFLFGVGFGGGNEGLLSVFMATAASGASTADTSGTRVDDGDLHHVAATYDGANVRFYVDGVNTSSPPLVHTVGNSDNVFRIGRDNNPAASRYFDGFIDEVAVYPTTLTGARISAHFAAASGPGATDYRDAVLADNPVAYYRLGETNTTLAGDSSTTANDGRFIGARRGLTGLLTGDADTAGSFDGFSSTRGFVRAPDNDAYTLGNTFTFEAWIQTTDGLAEIFSNFEVASPFEGFLFGLSGGKLNVYMATAVSGTSVTDSSPTTVDDGTPHYVAATYDGANVRFYVDGSLTSTVAANNSVGNSTNVFYIGRDANAAPSRLFEGTIDEVAVYPTALTQARITAHHEAGTGASATDYDVAVLADNPVAYFRLGDTDVIATDASATGNDGSWPGLVAATGSQLPGGAGNSVQFGNLAGSVQIPDNAAYTLGNTFTFEAWIDTTDAVGEIFSNFEEPAPFEGFLFGVGFLDPGVLSVFMATAASGQSVDDSSGTRVDDGVPHHVAATYDGANVRFYVDGVETSAPALVHSVGNSDNVLRIGRDNNNPTARQFAGNIDEVAIYDTTLSAARIASHFAAGSEADPVQMLSLGATQTSDGVLITWTTGSEIDCASFLVERCTDGRPDCVPVATIPCENALGGASYEALDAHVRAEPGLHYTVIEFAGRGRSMKFGPILVDVTPGDSHRGASTPELVATDCESVGRGFLMATLARLHRR